MRVLFRCDGNMEVGLGHVSRSVALAEALQDAGGAAVFHGSYDRGARLLLESARVEVSPAVASPATEEDARETALALQSQRAAALVVDGYAFDAAFFARVSEEATGRPLVVVDDFGRVAPYPRFTRVLNFTFQAEGMNYVGEDLDVVRGPRYMLVRRAVRDVRRAGGGASPAERVDGGALLIAVGGVDRHGLTGRVLRGLQDIEYVGRVDVVLRESAPDHESVRALTAALGASARLYGQLPHLGDRFREAAACVTGGGLTKYEACYLGVPCAVGSQSIGEAEDTAVALSLGLVADLGAASSEPELSRALARFLAPDVQARLAAACYASFPEDPTRDALARVLPESRSATS
jgi:spore coat polysaccharide biosynthesis predicted glycosyltransferase SpsG